MSRLSEPEMPIWIWSFSWRRKTPESIFPANLNSHSNTKSEYSFSVQRMEPCFFSLLAPVRTPAFAAQTSDPLTFHPVRELPSKMASGAAWEIRVVARRQARVFIFIVSSYTSRCGFVSSPSRRRKRVIATQAAKQTPSAMSGRIPDFRSPPMNHGLSGEAGSR